MIYRAKFRGISHDNLEPHEISIAVISKDELDKSRLRNSFAKMAPNNFVPIDIYADIVWTAEEEKEPLRGKDCEVILDEMYDWKCSGE